MRGRYACFGASHFSPQGTPRELYQGQRSTRAAALQLLADSCSLGWWYQILDCKTMEWEGGEINALSVIAG